MQVKLNNTIFTAVAEIDGRLIDGNSGWDVTKGFVLGEYLGCNYRFEGGRLDYYRNAGDIYQHTADGRYVWFCDASCEAAMRKVWGLS